VITPAIGCHRARRPYRAQRQCRETAAKDVCGVTVRTSRLTIERRVPRSDASAHHVTQQIGFADQSPARHFHNRQLRDVVLLHLLDDFEHFLSVVTVTTSLDVRPAGRTVQSSVFRSRSCCRASIRRRTSSRGTVNPNPAAPPPQFEMVVSGQVFQCPRDGAPDEPPANMPSSVVKRRPIWKHSCR